LERDGLIESDEADADGPQRRFRLTATVAVSFAVGCRRHRI
jgi:hypothetical protein